MALLDDSKIDIPCPKCGHKRSERIGKLKMNPKLTCSRCGTIIDISADQLRKAVDEIERSLAKLRDSLGELGKR